MWATMSHLLLGNIALGIFEGALLVRFFKAPKAKSIGLLIGANYLSSAAGMAALAASVELRKSLNIENIQFWFWIAVLAAFVMTVVIEFPFILWVFREQANRLRNSIRATLLIHIISYPLLFGWYLLPSRASIITRAEIVPVESLDLPKGHQLYYISEEGDCIIRSDLFGDEKDVLSRVDARDPNDRLMAKKSDNGYDLYLNFDDDKKQSQQLLLSKGFSELAPTSDVPRTQGGSWFNFGDVPKIAESEWTYRTGFWALEGIRGESSENQTFRYAMEMPLAMWEIRNATHLEGDYVVFQLGRNQICILQPQLKKIALIARGKGPVVVVAK